MRKPIGFSIWEFPEIAACRMFTDSAILFESLTMLELCLLITIDLFGLETARIFLKMDRAGCPASEGRDFDVDGIESFGNMVYSADEAAQYNQIVTWFITMTNCWCLTMIISDRLI